VYKLQV